MNWECKVKRQQFAAYCLQVRHLVPGLNDRSRAAQGAVRRLCTNPSPRPGEQEAGSARAGGAGDRGDQGSILAGWEARKGRPRIPNWDR